ncbi:MAG TPA: VWA domain-containing protein [Thermoanaerobaculia bacterium]|nr:VWA domain-containing protein [Thermoanaerobaculia bacterium]
MRVAAGLRFALCLLAVVPLGAQEAGYQETVEVVLHSLHAVVTDRDGKPVTGLTKEDFVLLEDGVPQTITNFSMYDSTVTTFASDYVPGAGAPPPPAPAAENAPPPRRFVFFVDEMGMQAMARKSLTTHALALVKSMRPGDVATIVRPTGTSRIVQDYTGDIETIEKSLRRTIDDCRIKLTSPAFRELETLRRSIANADRREDIEQAKRTYVAQAQARVEQRLGQIRALLTSMGGTPGKKVLVIITSGLSATPGREAYTLEEQLGIFEFGKDKDKEYEDKITDLIGDHEAVAERNARAINQLKAEVRASLTDSRWQGMERMSAENYMSQINNLARSAAADGVTIYALEPEVPLMLNASRGADSEIRVSTLMANHAGAREVIPADMLNQLLHHQGQTLTSLTEKTGGRWFRGIAAIDDTFRQVASDLQVYYSLAYRARAGATKPRRLQVSVKNRPDLKVRTRTEVIERSPSNDLAETVLAGLVYPKEMNDLKLTVTTDKPQKQGRAYLVPVEVVIPADKITFTRANDGKYRARVSVHYATAREEKEFVSYGRQEQIIELTDRQYAEVKKIRYRYKSSITVPRGTIRIALGVLDTNSKLSSLQTLSVSAK